MSPQPPERPRTSWTLPLMALLSACAAPQAARLDDATPTLPAEEEAAQRLAGASCAGGWSWLLPGAGQLCRGERGEGGALLGLTAVELGGLLLEPPGVSPAVWGIALQNTWIYAVADIYRDDRLAARALYTPQDSLDALVLAPVHPDVVLTWEVSLGVVGALAAAITWSALTFPLRPEADDDATAARLQLSLTDSLRFGGTSALLFSHVAIGEEILFRGTLHSRMAASLGEGWGWGASALIFGATHLTNLVALPRERWLTYATLDVPFITLVGAYLGWVYQDTGYSLASPVAVHFWYDTLLSVAAFAATGGEQPFQLSWGLPF